MDHINETKRNIRRQGTKVLHDIAAAYERGVLEDPHTAPLFCTLLTLVCEGKIEGTLDEASDQIKWSLTADYEKQLTAQQHAAENADHNVVRGPW